MTLRPLGARVFLKPDPLPEPEEGAIVLADTHFREKETPTSGEIVAIGKALCRECAHPLEFDLTVGQRVAVKPGLLFEEFDWDGQTLWAVPLDAIIGVVTEETYAA